MDENLRADSADLGKTISGWAHVSLKGLQISKGDAERIFQTSLAVRSLVYFQAILTLEERGLIEPAGAVLRVLVEHAFVLVAIRKEPRLMEELYKQDLLEKRKALGALRELSEESRPDWLRPELLDELHAETDQVRGSGGFSPYFWADRAGMKDVYNTSYRMLNVFSHGSMSAMTAYLKTDESGEAIGVSANARLDFAPQLVINGGSMILYIVDGLIEVSPMSGYFAAELQKLQDRFDSLHDVPRPR